MLLLLCLILPVWWSTAMSTSQLSWRTPKPNLLPPGHTPPRDDMGRFFAKHPLYRKIQNIERLAALEYFRSMGQAPPKKGANAGKRVAKKGKR